MERQARFSHLQPTNNCLFGFRCFQTSLQSRDPNPPDIERQAKSSKGHIPTPAHLARSTRQLSVPESPAGRSSAGGSTSALSPGTDTGRRGSTASKSTTRANLPMSPRPTIQRRSPKLCLTSKHSCHQYLRPFIPPSNRVLRSSRHRTLRRRCPLPVNYRARVQPRQLHFLFV